MMTVNPGEQIHSAEQELIHDRSVFFILKSDISQTFIIQAVIYIQENVVTMNWYQYLEHSITTFISVKMKVNFKCMM
jgi:hypothetical protein